MRAKPGTLFIIAALVTCLKPPVSAETRPAATIVSMEVVPKSVRLAGPHARRQLIVTGYLQDGQSIDLTDSAKIKFGLNPPISARDGGVLLPVRDGKSTVRIEAGGLSVGLPVTVTGMKKSANWSFENHVESVLSKQGCNAGTCHGAGSGKGGFKLTLRGYDPEMD